jgi:hypothetical protein
VKDIFFPFKVLISPVGTFNQLVEKPTAKGLVSLSALMVAVIAVTLYASATKIDLTINGVRTSFLATTTFNGWFVTSLALSVVGLLLYWLVFASGVAVISSMLGGKQTSWRTLLIGLTYLLTVFVVIYAVRAAVYSLLPTIYFRDSSSWPPMDAVERDAAATLITENWGTPYAYFENFLPLVTVAWLVTLGAIAVKTLREIGWIRAMIVSFIGLIVTVFIFGLP